MASHKVAVCEHFELCGLEIYEVVLISCVPLTLRIFGIIAPLVRIEEHLSHCNELCFLPKVTVVSSEI